MARHPDCIIIGGGVIGLSIAHRLLHASLRVEVFERHCCGRESSWAGAGLLPPMEPGRQDVLARFNDLSISRYGEFCAQLQEDSDVDPELERSGELQVFFDAVECRRRAGIAAGSENWRFLDQSQVRSEEPLIADAVHGAILCEQTLTVRNPRLLRALQTACIRKGAVINEGAAVESICLTSGRATGVRTSKDEHKAGVIILAAGAWSSLLPGLAGLMPVIPVRGQVVLLRGEKRILRRPVSNGPAYLVPRLDGHVILGSTLEPNAGYSKRTTAHGISNLISSGVELVPATGELPVEAVWAGLRPASPDGRPYLGPVPGFEGLLAATAHFRTGLTLAPATADYITGIILEQEFPLDMSVCHPGRSLPERPEFGHC